MNFLRSLFHSEDPTADSITMLAYGFGTALIVGFLLSVRPDNAAAVIAATGGVMAVILGALGGAKRLRDGVQPPQN